MSRIVLTTLNARYSHSSLGLRYLIANLKELRPEAKLLEFVVGDRPVDVVERILAFHPDIVGIGVSIWNVSDVCQLIKVLKTLKPELLIVLGGPEVSHEPLRVDLNGSDYIIKGEGEEAFYTLCRDLLRGRRPAQRTLVAKLPNLDDMELPYEFYTEEDVNNRVIYLEASRGCPFGCEFCLSSIDRKVRYFDINRVLTAIDALWKRGVRHYKFVDRSFNLDQNRACILLDHFLNRSEPYMLHFEMVPNFLSDELRRRLIRFDAGTIQLEVGIQTLNAQVADRIGRHQDFDAISENLNFLTHQTQVHLHLDLILGLPGESMESLADGLDRLMGMAQGEIQLGILKQLSGTAISRHDGPYKMVFSPLPPYELLSNNLISFSDVMGLKRMARFWDLYHNSGRFKAILPLLWSDGRVFDAFFSFSKWLFEKTNATHAIALERLIDHLYLYLTDVKGLDARMVGSALEKTFARKKNHQHSSEKRNILKRQQHHWE